MEHESCCDVGAAAPDDPAQVECGDVLAETALPAYIFQEVPCSQQALRDICAICSSWPGYSRCSADSAWHLFWGGRPVRPT